MRSVLFAAATFTAIGTISAQEVDKTQLAVQVSEANEANTARLKDYIWKRKSDAYVNNELKVSTLVEVKFGPDGKLVQTVVDAKSTVQAKPGIRGRVQAGKVEDNLDYVEQALGIMLRYTYMSKGELIDFFDKATVSTTADGRLQATGTNVLQQGDELTLLIDPTTHLFVRKTFKAKSGARVHRRHDRPCHLRQWREPCDEELADDARENDAGEHGEHRLHPAGAVRRSLLSSPCSLPTNHPCVPKYRPTGCYPFFFWRSHLPLAAMARRQMTSPRTQQPRSHPQGMAWTGRVCRSANRKQRPSLNLDARNVKAPARWEVKAPKGAPNIIVFLIDDMGFGHPSAFGGGIPDARRWKRWRTTAYATTASTPPRFVHRRAWRC